MLESAAKEDNVFALVELGLWYIQGNTVQRDRKRGTELWEKAAALGSREASIRLAVLDLLTSRDSSTAVKIIPYLTSAERDGSVLAQAALGSCYEQGWGVVRDLGEAARRYRKSAVRGSMIGFEALKKMHDDLRPEDVEFRITH